MRHQHGVIARWQLIGLGMHEQAIKRRIANGRLYRIHYGVYAVGRPELTRFGEWMAAVLACGPGALLSHESAAMLLGMLPFRPGRIHVTCRSGSDRRIPGLVVHRRPSVNSDEIGTCRHIPLTSPTRTLIDLATCLPARHLEAAVNDADKLDLIDPESLREALEDHAGEPGVRALRKLLDRDTFRLTDSELERRFMRIVRAAGLPLPDTQVRHERGRTDFTWTELGLVVETDGLRYHRTPSTQAEDNRRMQAHVAAGRTAIRFSHYEVRHEARRISTTLGKLVDRLIPAH
ncbi:MAG: hypothetical protein ACR2OC_08815 [Solirubrobacterales bacterium]